MDRKLIIRGAAVSVSAIAASLFLSGQFLKDNAALSSDGALSAAPANIRSASVVGAPGSASAPREAAPELKLAALQTSDDQVGAPETQTDFLPELTFAQQSGPGETTLCAPSMSALPAIDGLFELRLSAPCNGNERVVISHGDLAFSATFDADGAYTAYIPALAADVTVDAFLADDTYLQAETQISDHMDYARLIVQWSGAAKVDLHAYHGDAKSDDAGHIHVMNPFDPNLEQAFLIALGEPSAIEPMLAQVYSVPVQAADNSRVQLEIVSDAATCGTEVVAFVMSAQGPNAGSVDELRVAMPSCDGADGLVILDLPFGSSVPAASGLEFTSDRS